MQRVVLDANVLYPAPLRDSLMHLRLTRAFQAHWTNQIHDEWTRNLKRVRPEITNAQLQRIRDLMNHHARDALVTGFEKRIRGLTLPDPDDRHVLAAAIHVSATHIVTFNLKDFYEKQPRVTRYPSHSSRCVSARGATQLPSQYRAGGHSPVAIHEIASGQSARVAGDF